MQLPQKDSGSPLIVEDPDNDRNLQIGIVYGSLEECNDLDYPSLFARLDDYEVLKFIRATAFGDNIPEKVKGNTHATLGFLPKIPFKLTQSSHVALQKIEILTEIFKIIYFLTLKPKQGTLGFILETMKKIARWHHKSEI